VDSFFILNYYCPIKIPILLQILRFAQNDILTLYGGVSEAKNP